jgi:hypothetical protein
MCIGLAMILSYQIKSNNEILLQNLTFLREKHTFGKTVESNHEQMPLGPPCSFIGHVATNLKQFVFWH